MTIRRFLATLLVLALSGVARADDPAAVDKRLADVEKQLAALLKEVQGLRKELQAARDSRPADTHVYALKHADAAEAAKVLQDLFGSKGIKITFDARTNQVFVSGKDDYVKLAEAVL